jgi:LDH2 family malate/lactate/ureidoglycolate dehydrogenase
MAAPKVLVTAEALRRLVADLFAARGASPEDAETIADALVWANLRGVESHGVSRVARYLELFDKGQSDPTAKVIVDRRGPAVVVVDGHTAPGPVVMTRAAREAIGLAAETGVAWAAVRGTVHTGAIGYYTNMIAEARMAGIGIVAGVPNMAYAGGRGAGVATSPLSVAVPAGARGTVLLDMATAVVALGRLAQMKTSGTPLPPGVALTAEGEPTTDPALAAIPLPVGGAKGAGMSLVFELLASGLVANPIVSSFHSGDPAGRRHRQNGVLLAVNVATFLDVDEFAQIVDDTIDTIKALPRADGVGEILLPGERGRRTEVERAELGVPLGPKVWQQLCDDAGQAGVTIPSTLAG